MEMIEPVFENIEGKILEQLNNCKYSVHVASAWATNTNLFKKLIELKRKSVDVRIILSDDGDINSKSDDLFLELNEGITSMFKSGSELWVGKDLMHHKFCVIDYETVITGSFNWTNKAEHQNDENIVIIQDLKTANAYSEEFFDVLDKSSPYFGEYSTSNDITFRGQKLLLIEGETTKLVWNVNDATSVKLNGQSITQCGSKEVSINQDTVFVLSAEFEDGTVSKDVFIEHCSPPILMLDLDKEYVVENHQPVTITWKVENADNVYLHPYGEVEPEGTRTEFINDAEVYYLIASNKRFVKKTEVKECKVVTLSKIEQINTPFPDLELNLSIDLSEIQKNLNGLSLDTNFNLNMAQSFDELKSQVYIKNEITVPNIELEDSLKKKFTERVKAKLFKEGNDE